MSATAQPSYLATRPAPPPPPPPHALRLSVLEQVGRGALLVDDRGRVLEFTSAVQFGDGLQMTNGYLQPARPADRSKLTRFLSTVMGLEASSSTTPTTLALRRPSGLRPWLIEGVGYGFAVLLLITDVQKPARLSSQMLADVFDLTATEAKLACELALGKPLQEASAELGISEGHARQRLKSIFQKTGTSRQGELIALLARLG